MLNYFMVALQNLWALKLNKNLFKDVEYRKALLNVGTFWKRVFIRWKCLYYVLP